jgi:hypothetical protein
MDLFPSPAVSFGSSDLPAQIIRCQKNDQNLWKQQRRETKEGPKLLCGFRGAVSLLYLCTKRNKILLTKEEIDHFLVVFLV